MKTNFRQILTALLSISLCVIVLSACSLENSSGSSESEPSSQTSEAGRKTPDETSDMTPSKFTGTLGEFTTQDIDGNTCTQDIFKDYDLTMVNIFATWCSPCVAEMPDLEKLHQQMADRRVNVIGIVLDVLDENGEIIQEELEKARLLVEKTGVTYPILLPDETYMNGRLNGIEAIPETFFVDKNGNITGKTYSGSASLEDWTEIVEQELDN